MWAGRYGDVVVELPEVGLHPSWGTLSCTWHEAGRQEVYSVGKKRDAAAGVGNDESQVRAALEGSAEDKVGCGPGGVKDKLDHWWGVAKRCAVSACGQG